MLNALVSWLVTFAIAASPPAQHARHDLSPEITTTRYLAIARDVASVCMEDGEPPLEIIRGERRRERTALLLMALAFHESRFWARVDEGHCLSHECDAYGDGKHAAWSVWQIHPQEGITLEGTGFRYASMRSAEWKLAHVGEIYDGPALIRDRKMAVRFALRIARASIGNWSTAKAAMAHAARWYQTRPFKGEWVTLAVGP